MAELLYLTAKGVNLSFQIQRNEHWLLPNLKCHCTVED